MGGKSAPPAVPDYTGAAVAQGQAGIANTITASGLSNPNTVGPYGSVTYSNPQLDAYKNGTGGTPTGGGSGSTSATGGTGSGSGSGGSNYYYAPGNDPSSHAPGYDGLGMPDPLGVHFGANALGDVLGKGDKKKSTPSYGPSLPILGPGSTTQTVTLSPDQQALLDKQESTQLALANKGGNLAGSLGNVTGQINTSSLPALANLSGKVNTSGLPALTSTGTNIDYTGLPGLSDGVEGINNRVVDALYNQQAQYLDPQFSQGQSSMEAKLAAQGLNPNDEAYKNAMLNFNNQKQQAYSDARYRATEGGTQAGYLAGQQNLAARGQGVDTQLRARELAGNLNLANREQGFNEAWQPQVVAAQQNNASRAQGFSEELTKQNLPLQQIQQLLGLTAPTVPNPQGTAAANSAAPPDLLGALQSSYNGQLGATNAANAQQASTTGTMASLAMLALLA